MIETVIILVTGALIGAFVPPFLVALCCGIHRREKYGPLRAHQPKGAFQPVELGVRYESGDEIEVRPGDWIPITAPMVGDRNKGFFPCRRLVSSEKLEIPERLKQ